VAKLKFTQQQDSFLRLLKELRLGKNFTQKELAVRLGFPQSYMSKYETGERRLDFVETANICNALGFTIQQFSRMFAEKAAKSENSKTPKPN